MTIMHNKKLIINAGRIHTHNSQTNADSILITDDKITAIGKRDDFLSEIRGGIRTIDAENGVILPGFIDAHNHFCAMGEAELSIDIGGITEKDAIIARILEASADYAEDRPILCRNFEYDFIPLDHLISADDLDRVFPNRIIQLEERTGHLSVTNRFTLEKAGIDWRHGGCRCPKDPSIFTGMICGRENSRLCNFFKDELFSPEHLKLAIKKATSIALSRGVTGVHVICNEKDFEVLDEFQHCLPIHLRIYVESKDVEKIHQLGYTQIGGCGKVMVDGDTTPFTAAFFEPYLDHPSSKGILYYTDEELYEYVRAAHIRNMQIALHCVGDAASDQLIRVVERLQREDPRPLRHRVEHFEFANDAMIQRVKNAGMCFSLQPGFNAIWPHDSYFESLGDRALEADRIAGPVRSGAPVAFGSDCPVTECDPLFTIQSAVNHSNPAERIDVETAIDCLTRQAAFVGFEEKLYGTIDPGKIADLVILERDPLTVPRDEIKEIPVQRTIHEGEVVFSRI